MDEDEELTLLIDKPNVFVYEIPGHTKRVDFLHRAADWNIDHPIWYGNLLMYKAGLERCHCHLELRDPNGRMYGWANIKNYPGRDFGPVMDSSRYFTLNMNDRDGNFQLVGIGFTSRTDSADVHHVINTFFESVYCNNCNNERGLNLKGETRGREETIPAKRIKIETDPDVSMFVPEAAASLVEPEPVRASGDILNVEDVITKTGVMNEEEETTFSTGSLASENLLDGDQISQTRNDVEGLTEIHENLLRNMEPQEQPMCPQPQDQEGSMCNRDKVVKVLKCSFCSQDFQSRIEIINHFQRTHRKSVNTNTDSSVLQDLDHSEVTPDSMLSRTNDHYYLNISANMFKCDLCSKLFSTSSKIIEHWETVHEVEHFSCCECGLPFRIEKEMKNHRLRHHSFPCFICRNKFLSRQDIDEHLLKSHLCDPEGNTIHRASDEEFFCSICTGWFDFRRFRWIHNTNKHGGIKIGTIQTTLFSCPDCKEIPMSTSSLREHVQIVHGYSKKESNKLTLDQSISKPLDRVYTPESAKNDSNSGQSLEIRKSDSACEKDSPVKSPNILNMEDIVTIKTEIISEMIQTSTERETTVDGNRMDEAKSPKHESEMDEQEPEDLTSIHDNLLAIVEAQVQPPWPQPKPVKKAKWNLANFSRTFQCAFCSEQQKFHSRDDLIQHFRDMHAIVVTESTEAGDIWTGTPDSILSRTKDSKYWYISNGKFKCGICIQMFDSTPTILEHWKAEHGITKKLSCWHCGLPFRSLGDFRSHQRRCHSIPCLICGKLYLNPQDVGEHLLMEHLCDPQGQTIHRPGEHEFSCNMCSGWFDHKKFIWSHVQEKHAGRLGAAKTVPKWQLELGTIGERITGNLRTLWRIQGLDLTTEGAS
ncbi:unnamed protein product [Allacma fusca]|uniref:C2H2-type domain-containing protein n=1 Tax=Allacma fusca TaxID=39272 RepID=A0A8J2K5J1_9HEXA|nr:unnamed protein product [Allacma fusca]